MECDSNWFMSKRSDGKSNALVGVLAHLKMFSILLGYFPNCHYNLKKEFDKRIMFTLFIFNWITYLASLKGMSCIEFYPLQDYPCISHLILQRHVFNN